MKSELIKEEWRPVSEYIGLYEVSNFGRVRSLKYGKVRILKPAKIFKGYLHVGLWKDGRVKMFLVHRLVYEAFNGEIPDGMQVNHINELKTDCSVWNLNLMSAGENSNYGNRNKIVSQKLTNGKLSDTVLQLTPDEVLVKEWSSIMEAGRNGFSIGNISECCNGKRKTHKGFIWRKKY